jgi:hypothetical protein
MLRKSNIKKSNYFIAYIIYKICATNSILNENCSIQDLEKEF